MTWTDVTSASTPTWSASTSTTLTWTAASGASNLGNFNLMVDADPLADGAGGVDFNNTFSIENPWEFTVSGPIAFTSTNRNDP